MNLVQAGLTIAVIVLIAVVYFIVEKIQRAQDDVFDVYYRSLKQQAIASQIQRDLEVLESRVTRIEGDL